MKLVFQLDNLFNNVLPISDGDFAIVIPHSSILFIFGWLDDVFSYGAIIRLLVQIIVSTFFSANIIVLLITLLMLLFISLVEFFIQILKSVIT